LPPPATPAATEAIAATSDDEAAFAVGDLRALANEAPVIQFVNVMLLDALKAGASDVHVESTTDGSASDAPDGVLREVSAWEGHQPGILEPDCCSPASTSPSGACRRTVARRAADREVDLRVHAPVDPRKARSCASRSLHTARGLAELGLPPS
jgi:hypothetical protein